MNAKQTHSSDRASGEEKQKVAEIKCVKCGLIMPIAATGDYTADHWIQVKDIIVESLDGSDWSVDLVSDAEDIGVILKRIVQNIYFSDLVICDLSARNANVMFELGMRLAFDKPAILIKDDKTPYSFDTQVIEHLSYPSDLNYRAIQNFKTKLREKAEATLEASKQPQHVNFLKHFGSFVVASVEKQEVGRDDFLLNSIKDIQGELRLLRKNSFRPPAPINLPEDPLNDFGEVPGVLHGIPSSVFEKALDQAFSSAISNGRMSMAPDEIVDHALEIFFKIPEINGVFRPTDRQSASIRAAVAARMKKLMSGAVRKNL